MAGWQDYINSLGENFRHASGNTPWEPYQNWGSLEPIARMERIETLLDLLWAGGGGGLTFTLVEEPEGSGLYALFGSGLVETSPGSGLYEMTTYTFPETPPGSGLFALTGTR